MRHHFELINCCVFLKKMINDGFDHLLNQPSRQGLVLGNNSTHNIHYKNKYLKSFARGFDKLSNKNKEFWEDLRNHHYKLTLQILRRCLKLRNN